MGASNKVKTIFTWVNLLRFLSLALLSVLIASMLIFYRHKINPADLQQFIRSLGTLGPLIFILAYAIAVISFVPGSILTLTGGLLFGPVLGTLYNITGAVLGATGSFVISRFIAHDWIQKMMSKKLKIIAKAISEEGWRVVAMLRLVPLVPFNMLNYLLGVTSIRIWHYVSASAVFMLPGCFAYTYLGYVGLEAASGAEGWVRKLLFALALLGLVIFLPHIITRFRKQWIL